MKRCYYCNKEIKNVGDIACYFAFLDPRKKAVRICKDESCQEKFQDWYAWYQRCEKLEAEIIRKITS